ncbi:hypothetical protein [Pyrococcus abyssi]
MGGCTYDSLINGDIFQRHSLCKYYRELMEYIYNDVKENFRK